MAEQARRQLISSPEIPAVPHRSRSGTPVRPSVIRALLRTTKAVEEAGKALDRLLGLVTDKVPQGDGR